MYYGVIIGDEWFQEMIDGDADKRETWAEIIETRINIGVPYIIFRGNMNDGKPQVYKDKDYEINASNLCLAGDQRVVTSDGYKKAETLYADGSELTLFDGDEAIGSSRMKLRREDADVYKYTLANGVEQKVTEEHGMPVYDGRGEYHREEAQDVEVGDKIVVQNNKGIFGDRSMESEAFLLGLWQSDGTSDSERKHVDIWEDDFDLEEEVNRKMRDLYESHGFDEYEVSNQHGGTGVTRGRETPQLRDVTVSHSNSAKKRLETSKLDELGFKKGTVPEWIWESDEQTQWEYVRGLLIADGSAFISESNGNPLQIYYADVDREFLKELQLIFNNLGLSSQIRVHRDGGAQELPDGTGSTAEYDTQKLYRLIVGNKPSGLEIEKNTGFLSRRGLTSKIDSTETTRRTHTR